jgi:hypothetical protein
LLNSHPDLGAVILPEGCIFTTSRVPYAEQARDVNEGEIVHSFCQLQPFNILEDILSDQDGSGRDSSSESCQSFS